MFEEFAGEAMEGRAVTELSLSQAGQLMDALVAARKQKSAEFNAGAFIKELEENTLFLCGCGSYLDATAVYTAATLQSMAARNPAMGMMLGGPNIAALVSGRCPKCGNSRITAIYDPGHKGLQAGLAAVAVGGAPAKAAEPAEPDGPAEPAKPAKGSNGAWVILAALTLTPFLGLITGPIAIIGGVITFFYVKGEQDPQLAKGIVMLILGLAGFLLSLLVYPKMFP